MIFHAGVKGNGRRRTVSLTPNQIQKLGLDGEPKVLGCGESACAYEAKGCVVKLTTADEDACLAEFIRTLPSPPSFLLRPHAVWRLRDAYAIASPKAERLDPERAEVLDDIWDLDLDNREWDGVKRRLDLEVIENVQRSGHTTRNRAAREMLELVDASINWFRTLGMDWADYKSENWGLHEGRPVILDLGLYSISPPANASALERRRHRRERIPARPIISLDPKTIPVLPY